MGRKNADVMEHQGLARSYSGADVAGLFQMRRVSAFSSVARQCMTTSARFAVLPR